jgi:hypothetical protein
MHGRSDHQPEHARCMLGSDLTMKRTYFLEV